MSNLTLGSKIYIAGNRGLVGAALVRCFQRRGFYNLLRQTRAELNLTSCEAVGHFFITARPEYVIMAAAKVGGIAANLAAPVEFLVENLEIQNNILLGCRAYQVAKTIFLGSSCVYPREAPQPMGEEYFMSEPVEPTNASCAIAKIADILLAQSLQQQ